MTPIELYISIKYRLKERKMTYDQLSREIGYSRIWISTCMSNLKRGMVAPTHVLKAISNYLDKGDVKT